MSQDSQERNEEFRKSLELPYPLVGDPGGTILRAYKVRWPIVGLAQRVSYVIGRDRKIQNALHSELAVDSHVAAACETRPQTSR